MARKNKKTSSDVVFFDVIYEDGSRSSSRRVPASELEGPDGDGDAAVKAIIKAQDLEVARMSGRPRGEIKSVARSKAR
jgi:hypothetical protein